MQRRHFLKLLGFGAAALGLGVQTVKASQPQEAGVPMLYGDGSGVLGYTVSNSSRMYQSLVRDQYPLLVVNADEFGTVYIPKGHYRVTPIITGNTIGG